MNQTQLLAIRGVCFVLCLFIFILSALRVNYLINRERDRESYFWMGICLLAGILCSHLAKWLA